MYFDVHVKPTLADYIIENVYTRDVGYEGLFYHDGNDRYGNVNATYEAGDNSYRYSGADPDNYVCFGSDLEACPTDNLYRIIGLFKDDEENYQIKLIKYDYATSAQLGTGGEYSRTWNSSYYGDYNGELNTLYLYYWSSTGTNTWSASNLNDVNLNGSYITYLNGIDSKWAGMIDNHTWVVGGMSTSNGYSSNAKTAYNSEVGSTGTTYDAKIGLMYVSDYYYAASPTYWTTTGSSYNSATGENWIYMGVTEWTITRNSGSPSSAFYVYETGYVSSDLVSSNDGVRPVFYLTSSVKITGGSGSAADPYRISD